jgi:NADH-quinone oxidoreductase subunit N
VNPVLAEGAFTLPHVNYAALAPMLILFGAACVGVLVEAFAPRDVRYWIQVPFSVVTLVVALVVTVQRAGTRTVTAGGAIAVDGPALFLWGTLLVFGALSVLLMAERTLEPGGPFVASAAVTAGTSADRDQAMRPGGTEVYPLALFALFGMMLFCSANDLLTMFVALEVLSLPLYLLAALARRRRLLSQEAGLKYFLLGAFASAFFVFGIALLYGYAGQVGFGAIADAIGTSQGSSVLLLGGLAMIAVALLFKAALVPFHLWTPDVYQGSPTPVTAFMAACTKVAAFGGLMRVLYVAFGKVQWDFQAVLGAIAAVTMIVGAVLAVTQTDVKRLLAYSSIANAGYLLVGVLAVSRTGLAGSMFYLVAYGFAVLAAFAVVSLVRDADGETTHLSRWAGLGRRSPVFAALFTLLMLAFAGLPLTSGFASKFAVFSPAVGAGQTWLVIVGVISSMVLAFPYLRIVVLMWWSEPGEQAPTVSLPGAMTSAALVIAALVTVLLGFAPEALINLSNEAATFVR